MSKFSSVAQVLVPSFNVVYDNYSQPNVIASNSQIVSSIKSDFKQSIDKWGNAFEIFEPLLITLIAVESAGEKVGKNSAGAIGVMQLKEITIREAVSKFKNICPSDIPTVAKVVLQSKANYLLNLTPNDQDLSSSNVVKLETLLKTDTDFNIMLGCLCFRFALEFTKVSGKCYVDKAIIAYNTGVYGRINTDYKNKIPTTLSLFKDKGFSKETRNYLAKGLGVNGYWSLFVNTLN